MKVDRRFSESCTSLFALFSCHQDQRMELAPEQVNTIILVLGSHVAMALALENVKVEHEGARANDPVDIAALVGEPAAMPSIVAMRRAVSDAPHSNVVALRPRDGGR